MRGSALQENSSRDGRVAGLDSRVRFGEQQRAREELRLLLAERDRHFGGYGATLSRLQRRLHVAGQPADLERAFGVSAVPQHARSPTHTNLLRDL